MNKRRRSCPELSASETVAIPSFGCRRFSFSQLATPLEVVPEFQASSVHRRSSTTSEDPTAIDRLDLRACDEDVESSSSKEEQNIAFCPSGPTTDVQQSASPEISLRQIPIVFNADGNRSSLAQGSLPLATVPECKSPCSGHSCSRTSTNASDHGRPPSWPSEESDPSTYRFVKAVTESITAQQDLIVDKIADKVNMSMECRFNDLTDLLLERIPRNALSVPARSTRKVDTLSSLSSAGKLNVKMRHSRKAIPSPPSQCTNSWHFQEEQPLSDILSDIQSDDGADDSGLGCDDLQEQAVPGASIELKSELRLPITNRRPSMASSNASAIGVELERWPLPLSKTAMDSPRRKTSSHPSVTSSVSSSVRSVLEFQASRTLASASLGQVDNWALSHSAFKASVGMRRPSSCSSSALSSTAGSKKNLVADAANHKPSKACTMDMAALARRPSSNASSFALSAGSAAGSGGKLFVEAESNASPESEDVARDGAIDTLMTPSPSFLPGDAEQYNLLQLCKNVNRQSNPPNDTSPNECKSPTSQCTEGSTHRRRPSFSADDIRQQKITAITREYASVNFTGDIDAQTQQPLVAAFQFADFVFRVCGILPWRCRAYSRLGSTAWYRLLVISFATVAMTYYVDRLIASTGNCNTEDTSDIICKGSLLSDVALACGAVFGLFSLGSLTSRTNVADECRLLLVAYARREDFLQTWAKQTYKDLAAALIVWVVASAERARGLFAILDRGEIGHDPATREANIYKGLYFLTFVVSSGVLVGLASCLMHFCRALGCTLDTFCCRIAENEDLTKAVADWNVVQAILRKTSSAVEYCFFVFQVMVLVALLLFVVDWGRGHAGSLDSHLPLLPGVLVSLYIVRVFFCAAAISDKCARVPSVVNSLGSDDHEQNPRRQYVVQYIILSAPGFYVFETSINSFLVLKFIYFAFALAFGLATQVMRN